MEDGHKKTTLVTINIEFCRRIKCRFLGIADIKVNDKIVREIPRCSRLDCDNWIKQNNSEINVEIL